MPIKTITCPECGTEFTVEYILSSECEEEEDDVDDDGPE